MSLSEVQFNEVPSNILVPFFWGEFNSGGSPYENFPRPLLVGQKTSAGKAPAGVPYGPIESHNDAIAQFGPTSMLVSMYDMAASAAPLQPFWALPIADPTGAAAVGNITFTAPGVTGQAVLYVMGRTCTFQVNSSDTASMVCVNAAAAINALSADGAPVGSNVPVTAAQDGSTPGKCDVTFAHLGALGNGVELLFATDQPNVLNSSNSTVTALAAGSGVPSLATPLANLGSVQYDWIAAPYADSASTAALAAFLSDNNGRWSPAEQLFGHYTTSYLGVSLSTLVTFGNTQNSQHVTVFGGFGSGASPSPPWEVAASLCGIEALHLANPPELSRPLQTLVLPGIVPPRDQTTWWTTAERQALYSDGIAAGKVGPANQCQIDRMVTTYQLTAAGIADQTFLDIETMAQGMYTMRYFRTQITDEWGRAAFADEDPNNDPNVATPAKLANSLIFAYDDLCALGVAQHPELFQQYVVTVRNALDPDRCDAYIPVNVIGQLRVFAANVTAFRSYTSPGGAPLVPSAPGFQAQG
jgi:phage tail sheath gpL-like